jgi:ribosomal protein S12 methylthiotransferase accessory factor
MESFEGWHGEHIVTDTPFLRASEAREMAGLPTIDLLGLWRRGPGTQWMVTGRTNWVTGLDLISGGRLLVPYDSVSTEFLSDTLTPLVRSTNGLASGNTIDEATLHGIYEVLERDAISQWAPTAGSQDRVIDPNSIIDDYNGELLERLARTGMRVLVRWISCDTQIPVFAVTIAPGPGWRVPPYAAFAGYGAHLDPCVALARALTEAVQSRLTMIHGSRDDLWPSEYERVLDDRAAGHWASFVADTVATHSFAEVTNLATNSFEEDKAAVLALIEPVADEVAVVNLTRADFGIPVVKVIIAGMAGVPFDQRPRTGARQHPKGRKRWINRWKPALNAFAIRFPGRLDPAEDN